MKSIGARVAQIVTGVSEVVPERRKCAAQPTCRWSCRQNLDGPMRILACSLGRSDCRLLPDIVAIGGLGAQRVETVLGPGHAKTEGLLIERSRLGGVSIPVTRPPGRQHVWIVGLG